MMIQDLILAPLRLLRRLAANRRGNVLMLMGFSVIPLTLATGMSIDYARASRLQTKLNSVADAAALAAVTQQMMLKDNATAKTASENMFNVLRLNQPGLIWSGDLTVTVTGNDSVTSTRTAVVRYTAQSQNAFGGLLGLSTVTIGGTSTASATAAPNIDFYLALDTSPSMALPTTTAGINAIDTTAKCAFACHSNKIQNYVWKFSCWSSDYATCSLKSPVLDNAAYSIVKANFGTINAGTADEASVIDADGTFIYKNRAATHSTCTIAGNFVTTIDKKGKVVNTSTLKDMCVFNKDGTYVDTYWWAQNQGIKLRVDEERTAASNLMSTAKAYAAANNRTYRSALYTFDHANNFNKIASLTSNLDSVAASSGSIDVALVNDSAGNGCPLKGSCSGGNNYLFTDFNSLLTNMANELPAVSGKGTNDAGDKPKAYLFIVTDGVSDEFSSLVSAPYSLGSDRTRSEIVQAHIDQCTAIKNRGINIAILYTEYTPESIVDDEYNQRTYVTGRLPYVAAALAKCASPDLMYTVKTDQSISDALKALFDKAVATARIIN